MKFSALGTTITELPLKMTLPRRILSVIAKAFDKQKIHGESSVNSISRKQHKKTVTKNKYPELDWLDAEKAKKKRKADLERTERYKNSGM